MLGARGFRKHLISYETVMPDRARFCWWHFFVVWGQDAAAGSLNLIADWGLGCRSHGACRCLAACQCHYQRLVGIMWDHCYVPLVVLLCLSTVLRTTFLSFLELGVAGYVKRFSVLGG